MGEEKLGLERPASPRELATAFGILKGKSTAAAMRDAGYADTTANVKAGQVEARLRALGLLPTPQDARDVVEMMRQTVIGDDDGAALKQVFRVALSQAQAGDDKARRFIMDYLVGRPIQAVTAAAASSSSAVHVYVPDNGRGPTSESEIDQRAARILEIVNYAQERVNRANGVGETPP